LKQERALFYIERWRDIADRRQKRREERDLQDQSEVASYSSSRRSSIGPGDQPRRRRSTGSRLSTGGSQRSQGGSYSLHNHHPLQYRGRRRTRSPGNLESQQRSPGRGVVDQSYTDSSRGLNHQEKSRASRNESFIAYGDEPVLAPLHLANLEKDNGESTLDDSADITRKQKARVGFQFDDLASQPSQNLASDRENHVHEKKFHIAVPDYDSTDDQSPKSESDDTLSDRESHVYKKRVHKTLPRHDSIENQDTKSDIDEDESRTIEIVEPLEESVSSPPQPPKGILRVPREKFPEDLKVIREGVAPLKSAGLKGIPPDARWTKIDRRLVNPAALEEGHERFEERPDCVIVLRVLTKEEIQDYAAKTQEIRGRCNEEPFFISSSLPISSSISLYASWSLEITSNFHSVCCWDKVSC
jgi:hypothetical protein